MSSNWNLFIFSVFASYYNREGWYVKFELLAPISNFGTYFKTTHTCEWLFSANEEWQIILKTSFIIHPPINIPSRLSYQNIPDDFHDRNVFFSKTVINSLLKTKQQRAFYSITTLRIALKIKQEHNLNKRKRIRKALCLWELFRVRTIILWTQKHVLLSHFGRMFVDKLQSEDRCMWPGISWQFERPFLHHEAWETSLKCASVYQFLSQ